MKASSRPSRASSRKLILGMTAFAKISAIEGIHLSSDSHRMFEEFALKGLNAEQRRKAILAKHSSKA
jgi:hypothetical protein